MRSDQSDQPAERLRIVQAGPEKRKPRRLNRAQAAELSGLSIATIDREISRGTLKAFRVGGSRFILYSEFVRWLTYDPLDAN